MALVLTMFVCNDDAINNDNRSVEVVAIFLIITRTVTVAIIITIKLLVF